MATYEPQSQNIVFGCVTDKQNCPLANLLVKVYNRDMRSEQLLAEAVTNKDGKYEVTWQHNQLTGREVGEADIAVKVFARENQAELYSSSMADVRFNASPREEINITVQSTVKKDVIEYDYIFKEVTLLAGKVAIVDLHENKDHQDVTFLSKELAVSSEKIEYLVVAHRLQELSKVDAAFFYALLRENTLLKMDLTNILHARLSIGIDSDIKSILYDVVRIEPKTIRADIDAAVKDLIVSPKVAKESKRNSEALQKFKKDADEYYTKEHSQKMFDAISRFVLDGKIEELGTLFQEYKNDYGMLFEKITDPSFFSTEAKATDAKLNIALGELFGFDNEMIPHVTASMNITKTDEIKDLAKLNKKEWVQELTKVKEKTDSNITDTAISVMASNMARTMEKAFPTVAFTSQLGREKKSVLKNQSKILSFLTKNKDFDLTKNNIDLFIKDQKTGKTESAPIKEELKAVQRVFKLVPNYSKTNALRSQNINSSQNIVAVGETRFVKEIAPKAGIDTKEAKAIFRRAERTNTAAMLIAGEFQDSMRAMDVSSLESTSMAEKLVAVSKDFPNLKSLFKLTDVCACEHCRSVYSPAAYLVEILDFLGKRSVIDLTANPNVAVRIAKDILFKRRADLGDIDLGCENANTPVKYIDLVCELLEEAVSPDLGILFTGVLSDGSDPLKGRISAALLTALTNEGLPVTSDAMVYETEITSGSSATLPHYLRDKKAVFKIINTGINTYTVFRLRQTLSTAAELAAAPEYVNANAYTELSSNSFAFKLPFDLNHTEAKAYFNRFNVSRADLMTYFQVSGDPSDKAIAAEKLGLTRAERKLIANPKPTIADQQLIWNAPLQWGNPVITGNVVEYMKRVDHFLDKTNLTFKELNLLLTLEFIDPNHNLYIQNLDLSCDTEHKEIANLDESSLDRIHRFLRFQKKTGWKFEVVDAIISQQKLGNNVLNNACLRKAATLVKISEATGIKIEELIGFYGDIPHEILNDDASKPLYYQVFINKAKNGFIDEGLLPENINGSQLISNLSSSIAVCLQLNRQDLEKLVPLPSSNLTFSNLSYLFGASRLVKKLKLKVDDFIILSNLSSINFSDSPRKTLEFVRNVENFKKSPLKPADVNFILRHKATNLTDREIKEDKITSILGKLQKEYQNNYSVNKSRFDVNLTADEQKETLQNELPKLGEIGEDDVKIILGLLDCKWEFKWIDVIDEVAVQVLSSDISGAIIYAKNIFKKIIDAGVITTTIVVDTLNLLNDSFEDLVAAQTAYESALISVKNANDAIALSTDIASLLIAQGQLAAATAQEVVMKMTVENAATDLDNKKISVTKIFLDSLAELQFQISQLNSLEQNIATAFKTDIETVKIVLKYAVLKQGTPGNVPLSQILQSDTLIDTDTTHAVPILPTITATSYGDQYKAIKLLHKLLPYINSFKLSNEQIEWFLKNNQSLGWLEWDNIPFDTELASTDYNKYIDFVQILDLVKKFPAVPNPSDAENPITFLSVISMLLPGSLPLRSQLMDAISLLTGYDRGDIEAIDLHLFPVYDLNNYTKVKTWLRFINCANSMRTIGADRPQIVEYCKPVLLASDVMNLRLALKSRYDEDTWLETLKEIMDGIRPQKRNALVAYLLATNPEMKDENDLYDYFMVDVEMESCMPSSRIVQAHGTVQLFVQRCLMGLEPQATADLDNDSNWNQWKWMKNYRVWEANRKVFLYPENWIEADLRDNKSFLFTEFENEIQQNELNNFTAEEALIRYLEKLDGIAFLEVIASWYQTENKTTHVFARTKGGDPAVYYYRRFEQERYWTPWEKVELDITGDQLLAFVRNNRLCLAWPIFSEIPDPVQKAKIPNSTAGTEVDVDKPKRKLQIQLAVSEFSNKKWQPKRISKEGIQTPSYFTTEELPRDTYNLMYAEIADQIMVFSTYTDGINELQIKNGAFDIAGCKGYPELVFQGTECFPDFYPDFKDTRLTSQRYSEINQIAGDNLAVRNGISLFQFYEILRKTPGKFRITYPHQFTKIDIIVLIFEYLLLLFSKGRNQLKVPMGTLLPYFMEDSNHAYAIVPGFYNNEVGANADIQSTVKRTASDAMQLIEDIIALSNKYTAQAQASQSQNSADWVRKLQSDNEYQRIINEIKIYGTLHYGEQFKNLYHPLVCSLRKTLYKYGIPELMKRETQLQKTLFSFQTNYEPNPQYVPKNSIVNENGSTTLSYPIEDLDFSSDGSYSCYNWELFFHVPFLLATRLTKNQRFEEAQTWFHYIFNPTGALSGTSPQKYWGTKPFYLNQDINYTNQRIDTLLYKIADPASPERNELEFAIDQWRNNPFKPDVVARFRPVAYQKAVIMKYIDNLAEWGDYLFRQDTMESIVQATQMYILADKLLGPKPRIVPPVIKPPYETYNQIEAKLDAFGNALIDLENILPDLTALPEGGNELPPSPVTLSMLYFCIPQNDKMLAYWDKIADRLFKIRHCQNIDGIERSLALFAPPIDPAMLVRAAASGLDISAVLAGMNAPTPYYRFSVLSQKANELAQEVRGLGSSLLQALEKKDAEAMSLMRSEMELKVLQAVKDMKMLQIKESKEQIEILKRTKKVTEERQRYYASIEKINSKEQLNLDKLGEAHGFQVASQVSRTLSGILSMLPEVDMGVSGFGGTPTAKIKWGGANLSKAANAVADVLNIISSVASYEASRASILGGYDRRFDDNKLQERLANKELDSIEKQIVAAEIRKEIAETDLRNHDLQIDNAKKTDEFMRSKFTNKELYDWMIGQISSVYFSAYQLAHDFAKKAERCYKFELGNDDTFISYGYWDSMKKGLQSADHLIHDIKRMETSYLDKNKRENEINKHVPLAMLDPLALVRLRETGICDFDIPEVLFDMDYPGHYFRRIKSVSISIPCITGPYTSVSAKLSLVNNRYRKNTNPASQASGYEEDPGNDDRFIYNVGAIQSIAASSGQNDSGVFELNFKDERYLPFEGTGAIGGWRLELPTEIRQFDYNTISDVVIHIKYTAREGGSGLKNLANSSLKNALNVMTQKLSESGMHIALNVKHDFPNEWHLLKKNNLIELKIDKLRLPYMAQSLGAVVGSVQFIAKAKSSPTSFEIAVTPQGAATASLITLSLINELGLYQGMTSGIITLDTPFTVSFTNMSQINNLDELMMIVKYIF